jgi:hypothetical protein
MAAITSVGEDAFDAVADRGLQACDYSAKQPKSRQLRGGLHDDWSASFGL